MIVTGLKPFADVAVSRMWELPQERQHLEGISTRLGDCVTQFQEQCYRHHSGRGHLSLYRLHQRLHLCQVALSRCRHTLSALPLSVCSCPTKVMLIPLVRTLQFVGLYGTVPGLVLVHCIFGIPITALLFRGYYAGIPNELLDAAKIDGCGFFSIYRWILLPISMPAFAVVLLWQFTTIWNDYLIGLVVLSNPSRAPINVAVANLAGSFYVEWNVQMSGALIAALPTIIVYLLLGRLFMRGLLAGSLKG